MHGEDGGHGRAILLRFGSIIYLPYFSLRHDKIHKIHSLSTRMLSINHFYRSQFITASSLFNATDATSVV